MFISRIFRSRIPKMQIVHWQNILVVATIVTIWLENGNAQSSKEPTYNKLASIIPRRRRIPAGWWSPRRGGYGRRSQRAMGDEVWWVFYYPIKSLIQIRIFLFKQHGRIWSLSNQASHDPRNGNQAFKSNGWFEPSGLPDQKELLLKGTQPNPIQSNGLEDGGKVLNL